MKNKPGRKPRQDNAANCIIAFRATVPERELIKSIAAKLNKTVSDLCRERALLNSNKVEN